eukprot:TRINITY_DN4818_c0_g1_i6.p1 TRINITY_DN4818_c0_g1~~TRINITY_DN4818_c0_g1_i6.p1  ORF type:complete len:998 (-),score=422.06 TRINITY_DN4818_c0_g1_i6:73-3066(-)
MVFIKKVLIQGFKSYKDQTHFEDFDERVNVIVGRNGAGKSNFFYAIRFVLSDMFSNMRSEERQRLLHEGSGDTVMSAFVEIHFDNKDGRFPIDKEEVVLRRSIGLKKDEYFLDKKHVTKHDVLNLLESAGFSRSNPYYIVQQGKITALALMKDTERLDLLKEVAGTRVYDERRDESMKIMRDTEGKRKNIQETLSYIEERLSELETEKNELKEYQQLDRQRRALEYSIYDKELSQAITVLESTEKDRASESDRANEIHGRALAVRESIRNKEREIKNLAAEMALIRKEKSRVDEEKQDLIKDKARLELDVKEADAKMKRANTNKKKLEKEREDIQKQIAKTRKELESTKPKFENEMANERKVNERLANAERRVSELYAKQGRSAQFKTKKERDSFLKNEIKQIEGQIANNREQIATLEKEVAGTSKVIRDATSELEVATADVDERKQGIENLSKELNDLKRNRDELSNLRKDLWKSDSEMDSNIQQYKNELLKNERQLQSTVNKVISSGLQAVKRIATERNISGVYGPLIELFEVADQFMTAVEVTAGNALFHVVVDTDETAAKILEEMNREKVGRVTFIPLNQLHVAPTEMPENEDATPMINRMKFQPMFKKAFLQIFGKTLICRDIEVATSYARSQNLDCITLDGDQVSRKGALTGGYYDVRYSRLESMKNIKHWRSKLDSVKKEATKIKKQVQETDQQISNVLGEIQKKEAERNNIRDTYEQQILQFKNTQRDIQSFKEILDTKEQNRANLVLSLKQAEESAKALQSEIGTDLLAKLSEKEQQELAKLTEEIVESKKELITISTARTEIEGQKTGLENLLSNNLQKRLNEFNEELDLQQLDEQNLELESRQRELGQVQSSIDKINVRVQELDEGVEDKNKRSTKLNDEIDDLKSTENQTNKELQDESERMEKLLNRRSLHLQKKEESERKIREIGSLPSAEVESFKDKTLKQLMGLLHTTNTELKGYSHVNKKALEQYLSFTDQRCTFAALARH